MRRLFGFESRSREFAFECADCGDIHRGSPSFGFAKPPQYFAVPEHERAARVVLTEDACRIAPAEGDPAETIHAIRAVLRIPIHEVAEPFLWGVWVTQSEESFRRYEASFHGDQSGETSFGWLLVEIPGYVRTRPGENLEALECDVHWQGRGDRPFVALRESDHPLHRDQRDGISWERAIALARAAMHGTPPPA